MQPGVKAFFDRVSDEYDALIQVAIPRCAEAFWMMLYYLPDGFAPQTILELGCGTGNLTRHLAEKWPNAAITVVDISAEMLQKTRENVQAAELNTVECAFETLAFDTPRFDLVASSFAIHHLHDADKARLIQKIHGWLKPGGFMVWADGFNSGNPRLHQANMDLYEALAREKGATEAQIVEWRDHRAVLDHYPKLSEALAWFQAAGFDSVDVLWRYCQNAILQGQKP